MITKRQGIETFFFITLATAVMLFVMIEKNKASKPLLRASVPIAETTVPTSPPSRLVKSVMASPDEGTKTLILEGEKNGDETTYSLFISSTTEDKQLIAKKEETDNKKLEIPFNTWSPNNAYVFLKEGAPETYDYFVFKTVGDIAFNTVSAISIQELFTAKVQGYVIADVTGWAAPGLLIVNTKAIEGDVRVSFWFDVASQSFIQLGTYFK